MESLPLSPWQTIMTAEIEGHDRQTIFQNRTLSHEMMEAAKAMHTESLNRRLWDLCPWGAASDALEP